MRENISATFINAVQNVKSKKNDKPLSKNFKIFSGIENLLNNINIPTK